MCVSKCCFEKSKFENVEFKKVNLKIQSEKLNFKLFASKEQGVQANTRDNQSIHKFHR